MKKIVMAGGTGFIGKYLEKKFKDLSYNVIIISRRNKENSVNWNDEDKLIEAISNADILINLAGKSVDCRYTQKNKTAILNSRVNATKLLGNAIMQAKYPPRLWINSATATIYRHAEDRPMTETSGEIGTGFSVNVAKAWEKAFLDFYLPNTRKVLLRMAIVLGKDEGVMKPLKNLVHAGLGGKQGNGNQMFSWIHIEDLFQIILFISNNEKLNGIYNCASPNPLTNKLLMHEMCNAMHVKIGVPLPVWMLKLGAIFIRTETELVLKSRWVLPERLLNDGYKFLYPNINVALKDLCN